MTSQNSQHEFGSAYLLITNKTLSQVNLRQKQKGGISSVRNTRNITFKIIISSLTSWNSECSTDSAEFVLNLSYTYACYQIKIQHVDQCQYKII